MPKETIYPFVSVLVAARNEEESISNCLASLLASNYPSDRFEVLIGNDSSEDRTQERAEAFAAMYTDQIFVMNVKSNTNSLKGKVNVLHQLSLCAKGDILLFTDADSEVNEDWMAHHVHLLSDGKTVVTGGVSLPIEKGILAGWQTAEWLNAFWGVWIASRFNWPLSVMGNNMGVTKSAFDAAGGFLSLDTLTEDVALLRLLAKTGKYQFSMDPHGSVETASPQYFDDLLQQRRRWSGAVNRWIGLSVVLLWYFRWPLWAGVLSFWIGWPVAILILWAISTLSIALLGKVSGIKPRWLAYATYELYALWMGCMLLFTYFSSPPTVWKGRVYH